MSEKNLIIATRQFLSMTLEDKLQRQPPLTMQEKSTHLIHFRMDHLPNDHGS
jgi:hypothetical protein